METSAIAVWPFPPFWPGEMHKIREVRSRELAEEEQCDAKQYQTPVSKARAQGSPKTYALSASGGGVATDSTEHPCAFVTFTPIYGPEQSWGWTLDLMRRLSDTPPYVMDLLIVRAVERFRAGGANVVSLGLVGLADTNQEMKALQW